MYKQVSNLIAFLLSGKISLPDNLSPLSRYEVMILNDLVFIFIAVK